MGLGPTPKTFQYTRLYYIFTGEIQEVLKIYVFASSASCRRGPPSVRRRRLKPSFPLSRGLPPIRRQETDFAMSRQSGGLWHFFSYESFMPCTCTSLGTNRGEGPRLWRDSTADDDSPAGRSPPGRAQLPAIIRHGRQGGSDWVDGSFTAHSLCS